MGAGGTRGKGTPGGPGRHRRGARARRAAKERPEGDRRIKIPRGFQGRSRSASRGAKSHPVTRRTSGGGKRGGHPPPLGEPFKPPPPSSGGGGSRQSGSGSASSPDRRRLRLCAPVCSCPPIRTRSAEDAAADRAGLCSADGGRRRSPSLCYGGSEPPNGGRSGAPPSGATRGGSGSAQRAADSPSIRSRQRRSGRGLSSGAPMAQPLAVARRSGTAAPEVQPQLPPPATARTDTEQIRVLSLRKKLDNGARLWYIEVDPTV